MKPYSQDLRNVAVKAYNDGVALEALHKAIGVNVHLSAYWRAVRETGFTVALHT